jgi:hypothetical protein
LSGEGGVGWQKWLVEVVKATFLLRRLDFKLFDKRFDALRSHIASTQDFAPSIFLAS